MPARALIPLLIGLVAGKLALDHLADVDLVWHLRLGLDMLASGELPRAVDYSWTLAGAPYLPNDWLAELLLALGYRAAGFTGVALVKAAAVVALALTLYRAALERTSGHARAAGLATGVMLFVAATNFIARPVLFGQLCLAAELLLLERALRGSRRALVGLPLVMAAWINVHGSWPVGMGPLVAAACSALLPWKLGRLGPRPVASGVRRALLVGLAVAPLGLLANPLGPAGLLRPFRLVGRQADLTIISEWSPVPLSDPSAWVLLGAAALVVLACLFSRAALPVWDLGLVALTAAMAFSTALYHIVFAVMAAPVLAEQLAARMSPRGFENRRANAAMAVAAALLLGAVGAAKLAASPQELRAQLPVDAVEALERSGVAGARGFNFFDFGGYLVYRRIPTFIDGRLEPFLEAGVFDRYVALERGGDPAALEGQGICWALLRPESPLDLALGEREGWRLEHEDEQAVLWVREGCGG